MVIASEGLVYWVCKGRELFGPSNRIMFGLYEFVEVSSKKVGFFELETCFRLFTLYKLKIIKWQINENINCKAISTALIIFLNQNGAFCNGFLHSTVA